MIARCCIRRLKSNQGDIIMFLGKQNTELAED